MCKNNACPDCSFSSKFVSTFWYLWKYQVFLKFGNVDEQGMDGVATCVSNSRNLPAGGVPTTTVLVPHFGGGLGLGHGPKLVLCAPFRMQQAYIIHTNHISVRVKTDFVETSDFGTCDPNFGLLDNDKQVQINRRWQWLIVVVISDLSVFGN